MRSLFLISTWIVSTLVGCAPSAKRAEPRGVPPPAPVTPGEAREARPVTVGTLSVVEHRVMDKASGLPTDRASTIDEYVGHLRTIRERSDGPEPSSSHDGGATEAGALDRASDRSRPRVFVGGDLVTVELEKETTLLVRRGKTVVYRRVLPETRQRFQVEQLTSWNGHWVLEYDGDVVIDGESLKRRGYTEVFDWMLVGGEPLFFFVKDGHVGIHHRGEELSGLSYDHVLHGGCCEMSGFNPRQTSWGVRFHGRRGVTWYYVELATSAE